MDMEYLMERQCTAHSKQSAKRCKRYAIPGGGVCTMHGGKAPQVKTAARARILAMVDPALGVLETLLRKSKHDPTRLNAIKEILDRAGLATKQQIEISVEKNFVPEWFQKQLTSQTVDVLPMDGSTIPSNHRNGSTVM